MSESLCGKRVVVMGLGRFGGGVGVSRWLCGQGAKVLVTDLSPADQLTESISELAGLDITYRLGGHDEADLAGCDLLVVNPAVPDDAPFLLAARSAGVPMTTEINLFLERCPARMVGITGSVGKSTSTALAGLVLASKYVTHVGGNIGRSLLEDMSAGRIAAGHAVVLELSSFQLAWVDQVKVSPHVALVTNLQANHLDRHGTMEAYGSAKKNIFRYQQPGDVLIVNAEDSIVAGWSAEAPGKTDTFSLAGEPFELAIPGRHNQLNAQAAWAIGRALGVARPAAQAAMAKFPGLPHRLELVAERDGVRYFNDSKATTPAGSIVALESFPAGRVVAIVGGYDKHLPLEDMCRALARQCKAVVATGQVGPQLVEGVRQCIDGAAHPTVAMADSFDQAVQSAMRSAEAGDIVLLSPGCASYGQFNNYIERGERFACLAGGACGQG